MQEKTLVHAAATRRVRPRRKPPRACGAYRDPYLLECAPVVRRALVGEEPAPVGLLEREIHLEPAPVRAAGIGPAALVTVNAEPGLKIGRVGGLPPRVVRAMPPTPFDPMQPRERARGEPPRVGGRRATVHHRQPVPRIPAKATDVAPPHGCRPE